MPDRQMDKNHENEDKQDAYTCLSYTSRLAYNIKKTQKLANAGSNSTIPKYEKLSREIQDYLEEKEREEFTRQKVVKKNRMKNAGSGMMS